MKKIAVIGLGSIASRHRRNIKEIFPHSQIIAMSASSRSIQVLPENTDQLAENIGAVIEKKPDFCIVASPASHHAELAIPLLQAGIPCLIEKPITSNKRDAQLIATAASKTGTAVSVGYCLRYLPAIKAIKALLDTGRLGKLYNIRSEVGQYLPDWRPDKDYRHTVSAQAKLGGGALLELSHEFDYLQFLFGNPELVHAQLRKAQHLETDVEDIVDIVATYNDDIYCSIHLDFIQKPAKRSCIIIAERGRLEWDLIRNEVSLYNQDEKQQIYQDDNYQSNTMYIDMLTDFDNLIKHKPNNCPNIDTAINTVSFIELIKRTTSLR